MKKMIEKKKMKNKGKKREQKLKSFSALFFCCCCVVLTRRGGSDDARRRRRSCLVKGERNPSLFLVLLLYLLRATKSEKERIGINIPFSSSHLSPRLFSSPTEPTTKTRRKRNKRKKERELKAGRRTRTRKRQTRFCLCLSRRWDTKEETYRKRWLIVRWLTYYLLLGELLLVFVVWKEKKNELFRVFSVFFATFWTREFFPCPTLRETLKSQKETENSHSSTPHNNNIIIIR